MKFSIKVKEFRSIVADVASVVPMLSPIPGLSGIVIKINDDNMVLTGSDANIFIEKTIKPTDKNELKVEETGEFILEARYLNNILKRAEGETIFFSSIPDKKGVRIQCGKTSFMLNTFKEYVAYDLREIQSGSIFEMHTDELKSVLTKLEGSMADKHQKARPILGGVHYTIDRCLLTCDATNGFILTRSKTEITLIQEGNCRDVVLARKPTNILRKTLPREDTVVRCGFNSNRIQFRYSENNVSTVFQSGLIAGTYPAVGKVIPERTKNTLEIKTAVFETYLERVSAVREEEKPFIVEITMSGDGVEMRGENLIGTTQQTIPASDLEYSGERTTFMVNYEWLHKIVAGLRCEDLVIGNNNSTEPIKVTEKNQEKIVSVAMPTRSYK